MSSPARTKPSPTSSAEKFSRYNSADYLKSAEDRMAYLEALKAPLPWFLEQLDPTVYLSDNYVVVDLETDTAAGPQNYGHPRHAENQLLLACLKSGPDGPCPSDVVFPRWANELGHNGLALAVELADFVVAHNAKYELGWFKRMGLDLRKILVYDTKLAEYVLLGNLAAGSKELGMAPRSTSLDMCCRRRGWKGKDPAVDIMIKDGINPREIPRPWLQGRCEQDVIDTERLFLSQRTELQERGLLPVQFTRCLLTPVLADIEQEGLCVDKDAVLREYEKYSKQRQELQARMDALTGGINTRSPIQMAQFLYSKEGLNFRELTTKRGDPKRNAPTKDFPDGTPMTDQKTIEKLEVKTARQREFIVLHKELSKANAMLSKNLDFYRGVVEEYDGEFFGEIHQTSTATQRTASTGVPLTFQKQLDDSGKPVTRRVQFQNTPRVLKKLFKAKRPGWLVAEPDCSQAEFRAAADLGDDKVAQADIVNPEFDAYVQTAAVLHACSKEEVLAEKKAASAAGKDDWRQLAKPDTFKPLYGGRFGTPEQERYYKWFREHYCGISRAQDQWVNEALETKRQKTPWGLIYYWPTAKRINGRVNCETAVDNYPIQALATAEIAPIAVVYLWHRLPEYGIEEQVRIVNMVHDSAPSEVHPDAVEPFTALVKRAFTADVYHYLEHVYGMSFDKVPLGVGLKIGEHWGEGQENSWDIYKDGREVKRK